MDERGQVLPLVAVLVVVMGVMALGMGRLGHAVVARAQAATAADAAALAGAAAGREAARSAAVSNGGRVLAFSQDGNDTTVVVQVGEARATARARRSGGLRPGEPPPALRAALARAGQLLGAPVPIVPPSSGRGRGRGALGVEVAEGWAARLAAVGAQAGLCRPYPQSLPVYFELCPHRLP